MLINPSRMVLIYKTVRFDIFEFEESYERGWNSSVLFFAPICSRCVETNQLIEESKQEVSADLELVVECGVRGCSQSADYFIEFNFGFEEGDVEENREDERDIMDELYDTELNFD